MLRGRLPWSDGGDDEVRALRRLLIAALHQAVKDARAGDGAAEAWLDEAGPVVAVWLGLPPGALAGWRAAGALGRRFLR